MDDGEADAASEAYRFGEPGFGRARRPFGRMAVRRRAPTPFVGQDDGRERRAGIGAAAVVGRGRRVGISLLWQG